MERIYIDGDMAQFTRKDITTVDVTLQDFARQGTASAGWHQNFYSHPRGSVRARLGRPGPRHASEEWAAGPSRPCACCGSGSARPTARRPCTVPSGSAPFLPPQSHPRGSGRFCLAARLFPPSRREGMAARQSRPPACAAPSCPPHPSVARHGFLRFGAVSPAAQPLAPGLRAHSLAKKRPASRPAFGGCAPVGPAGSRCLSPSCPLRAAAPACYSGLRSCPTSLWPGALLACALRWKARGRAKLVCNRPCLSPLRPDSRPPSPSRLSVRPIGLRAPWSGAHRPLGANVFGSLPPSADSPLG